MTNRDPCTQPLPFLSATFFFPPPLIDMVDIFMSQTFLAQFDPSSYTPPTLSHATSPILQCYIFLPPKPMVDIFMSPTFLAVMQSSAIVPPQTVLRRPVKKTKHFMVRRTIRMTPPPVCSGNLDLKKRRHILTLYCNIFEGENWNPPQGGRHIRKIDLFRALPKLPLPPSPNSGKLYNFFWTSKTTFSAYYRTK